MLTQMYLRKSVAGGRSDFAVGTPSARQPTDLHAIGRPRPDRRARRSRRSCGSGAVTSSMKLRSDRKIHFSHSKISFCEVFINDRPADRLYMYRPRTCSASTNHARTTNELRTPPPMPPTPPTPPPPAPPPYIRVRACARVRANISVCDLDSRDRSGTRSREAGGQAFTFAI